ncbi:MAG: PqqD family peptide modification chaperone [Halioglobus sp.]|nr:PqqD family peptide modification chaperone [Halioglobus sp.]
MTAASIFVSIAAYREFDLPATLRSALGTADDPARLHLCVCWQRDDSESLEELASHPRLQVIDIPYRQSRGVCWARHLIQQQYRGERYYLQLDGHHRFAPGWDTQLVEMLEQLRDDGVPRPVLTTYLPSFEPHNDPAARDPSVWLLGADRFDDSGVVFMRPYIPAEPPQKPVLTRFWSAHFSFSDGRFVQDVPLDPNGYFHGEEIGTCVRAWTSGYDFYCPHKTLLWHEYTRRGRRCHWDDHDDWNARNEAALSRYRALLGVDGIARIEPPGYGLGSQRSLADYERFAGISFADRSLSAQTLAHAPPDAAPQPGARGTNHRTAGRTAGQRIPRRSVNWREERLDDELVLHNTDSTQACYLNTTAALVWQLIDGTRDADDIRELLQAAYPDADSLREDVTLALSQLLSQRAISY